jgi:hypothetical protein
MVLEYLFFYHRHCGIKVMMMLNSTIASVLVVVSLVLPLIGLERRTVSLIVCFTFMVALMLSFACDQMVLLQTVLSLVA